MEAEAVVVEAVVVEAVVVEAVVELGSWAIATSTPRQAQIRRDRARSGEINEIEVSSPALSG